MAIWRCWPYNSVGEFSILVEAPTLSEALEVVSDKLCYKVEYIGEEVVRKP